MTSPASAPSVLRALALALAALVLVAQPAQAQNNRSSGGKAARNTAPVPANIDRNGVLMLVRTTLLALDQANKTGNYTVLRDLGAPAFRSNDPSQLADIFAPHRREALDLAAVAVLEPQLTLLPQIEPSGMLNMAGFFPSVPMQVNFQLLFVPENRKWKIYGISVNLSPGGPQAPDTPAEEPQTTWDEIADPPVPTVNPRRNETPAVPPN